MHLHAPPSARRMLRHALSAYKLNFGKADISKEPATDGHRPGHQIQTMAPSRTSLINAHGTIAVYVAPDRGAQHEYDRLLGQDDIRLLILQPATNGSASLCISFRSASLDILEGEYEAISYTWGEPRLAFPLYLEDGTYISVTENLDSALRAFRLTHKSRTLWADAVCIDQSSDSEKAVQIPLMAQIFCGASRVLAWLGRSADGERGIAALQKWSRHRIKHVHHVQPWSFVDLDIFEQKSTLPHHHRPGVFERAMQSVEEPLQSPWFTRLWIIQEVVFNLDVVLVDGDSEMSWTRFMSTLHLLRDYRERNRDAQTSQPDTAIQLVADLWKFNSGFEGNKAGDNQLGMMRLLRTFENHGCADGRDRIFALYSMANDIVSTTAMPSPTKISMDIDYSLDVQGVFQTFANACIARDRRSSSHRDTIGDTNYPDSDDRRHSVFAALLARQFQPNPATWPSWLPDWRKELKVHQDMFGDLPFRTCYPMDGRRVHAYTSLKWWNPSERAEDRIDEIFGVAKPEKAQLAWNNFPTVSAKFQAIEKSFSTVQEIYDTLRQRHTSTVAYSKEFLCQILSEIWPPPQNIDLVKDYFHPSIDSTLEHDKQPFKQYIHDALSHACFFAAATESAAFIGFGNQFLSSGDKLLLSILTRTRAAIPKEVETPLRYALGKYRKYTWHLSFARSKLRTIFIATERAELSVQRASWALSGKKGFVGLIGREGLETSISCWCETKCSVNKNLNERPSYRKSICPDERR